MPLLGTLARCLMVSKAKAKVMVFIIGALTITGRAINQAGIEDAAYDHNNNLVYNPYPACCHSQIYSDDFKRGYDEQWNTYQSQEQQTDQHTNIYINNSPRAYVNTQQSSNQGQDQSQQQGP